MPIIRLKASTSKGFGLFHQLHYNLNPHFTPVLQSVFYIDQLESPSRSPSRKSKSKMQVENPSRKPSRNLNSIISLSQPRGLKNVFEDVIMKSKKTVKRNLLILKDQKTPLNMGCD